MKYVVILGDGMADHPIPELNGKTPLQDAKKPHIDNMASKGLFGIVNTIPKGMAPGSDIANLSVMGYDPLKYYTGRSPLEAISMGIELGIKDKSFRCNLVTLSDEADYKEKTMVDYSSDEISSEEAFHLIKAVNDNLKSQNIEFHAGISYRHCMVWHDAPHEYSLTPPHDISGRKIHDHLPTGKDAELLLKLMVESHEILKNHNVNLERIKRGLRPANSIWLWGEGTKPTLPCFFDKYHLKGSVISAVDLVKGLGISMGLSSINVEGATGNINTNFYGKAMAALKELKSGQDFVYIHIEAPDECGHRYEIDNKVKAIELIDEYIVGPIIEGLENMGGEYKVLVLPDHPTPLALKTHTDEPVPFVIYNSSDETNNGSNLSYNEIDAKQSGIFIDPGYTLMDIFIKGL